MALREAVGRMSPLAKVGSVLWASVAVIVLALDKGGLLFDIWTFPGSFFALLFAFPLASAFGDLGLKGPGDAFLGTLTVITAIASIALTWATWFLFLPQVVVPFFRKILTGTRRGQ